MKRILLLLALAVCLAPKLSNASHVMGGDISFACMGNGIFQFTVTIYRDCTDSPFNSAGWTAGAVTLVGPVGANLPLISSTDVSARCATNLSFRCNPPSTGNGNNGSISRFVYQGNVNLSGLGAAPAGGYTWFVAFPCCRPSLSNTIGSQQALQVKMFAYTNPSTGQRLTPAQLCDQSPHFTIDPTIVAINNPNDTLHLQYIASDVQSFDSTVYAIDFPLANNLIPYAYNPPYSQGNPLPGIIGPPYVAAANTPIHKNNGEIVLRPAMNGNYVLVVKAISFRHGQRIAEVFRDVTLKVITNPAGGPPPFIPNPTHTLHSFSQRAPIIYSPRGPVGDSIWNFTYYDEDTIALPIQVKDLFPLFSGNPNSPTTWVPQTNPFAIGVTGLQLSTTNNPAADCGAPPCATLRGLGEPLPPAPVVTAPASVVRGNGNPIGLGYTDTLQGGFTFVWMPRADSLLPPSQAQGVKNYQFLLTAVDRNCPLEGETNRVMHFRIKPLPVLPRPVFDSIAHDNGQNTLYFRIGFDSLSMDPIDVANYGALLTAQDSAAVLAQSVARRHRSFERLNIYKALNYLGPYQQVASLNDPSLRSWLDTSRVSGQYFYLEVLSSRPHQSLRSLDTLSQCIVSFFPIASPTGSFFCAGGSALLSSGMTGANVRNQWFRNGQVLSGATQHELTITLPGTYQVEVYDSALRCSGISQPLAMQYYPAVYNEERICAVSVNPSQGSTTVYWEKTAGVHIARYHVYRETNIFGAFEHIGSVAFDQGGAFVDTATARFSETRRYRIAAEDFCGARSDSSSTHRPMSLDFVAQANGDVDLSWTPYEGFTLFSYDIMRSTGGAFQTIGTVDANTFSFRDLAPPVGPKVYFIRSGLGLGCQQGPLAPIVTTIHSNAVSLGAASSLHPPQIAMMKVYPNPTSGSLTFEASAVPDLLILRNVFGQALRKIQPDQLISTIDMFGLRDGPYFLEVHLNQKVYMKNIVLQKDK